MCHLEEQPRYAVRLESVGLRTNLVTYARGVDTSSKGPCTSKRSGRHAFVDGPYELEFGTVRRLHRSEVVEVDALDAGVRVAGVDVGE